MVGRLGEMVWTQWDELRHAAAVIGTVLYVGALGAYRVSVNAMPRTGTPTSTTFTVTVVAP